MARGRRSTLFRSGRNYSPVGVRVCQRLHLRVIAELLLLAVEASELVRRVFFAALRTLFGGKFYDKIYHLLADEKKNIEKLSRAHKLKVHTCTLLRGHSFICVRICDILISTVACPSFVHLLSL